MSYIAGVDEAGRGALIGEVVAAAVVLDPNQPIKGLMDSKKLSETKRIRLAEEIRRKAIAWAIARASAREIDRTDILQASLLAMKRAVKALPKQPDFVKVDGNIIPQWNYPSEAIVKGDARETCISAASILAKVARDSRMYELHSVYPEYGFNEHKGYPTAFHIQKLRECGPLPEHRLSYKPVRELMKKK